MTFLEQVLNEPMNNYIRVKIKPSDSLFKLKNHQNIEKEEQDDSGLFYFLLLLTF